MRTNVAAGNQPWLDSYDTLAVDSHSSSSFTIQGPFAFVTATREMLEQIAGGNLHVSEQKFSVKTASPDSSHYA